MAYHVKEIFYSLQGEGANAGRPAVFCRFAGCNLWSGRPEDRASAVCQFCDTDFVGTTGPDGGPFSHAHGLVDAMASCWPNRPTGPGCRFAVLTGGEPTLQVDQELIEALHSAEFEVAIETNGTRPLPRGVDWICVSPKAGTQLVQQSGDEIKLVYPQPGAEPIRFEHLDFQHFFLQPMDGPDLAVNTKAALDYCLKHPHWRLSMQLHKILGIR